MKPMPPRVARFRRDVCLRCPAPCAEHQAGQLDLTDPRAACPAKRWFAWWTNPDQPAPALGKERLGPIASLAGASPPKTPECAQRRASALIGPLLPG
jgi:hypothetical protein